MNLSRLQDECYEWRDANFPDYTAEDQLMGMMEELGELAHSYLKAKQKIRGSRAEHKNKMADALGDLIIYATGFCDAVELDLATCVSDAWHEVKERNWVAHPTDGVTS